jgi:hypothetical protein
MSFSTILTGNIDLTTINRLPYPPEQSGTPFPLLTSSTLASAATVSAGNNYMFGGAGLPVVNTAVAVGIPSVFIDSELGSTLVRLKVTVNGNAAFTPPQTMAIGVASYTTASAGGGANNYSLTPVQSLTFFDTDVNTAGNGVTKTATFTLPANLALSCCMYLYLTPALGGWAAGGSLAVTALLELV